MLKTAVHRELMRLNFLHDEDFEVLDGLLARRRRLEPGRRLITEGDTEDHTTAVLDGWAFRFKDFADGRRQVINFLLPGDLYGLYGLMIEEARCSVETLTAVEVASFPSHELVAVFEGCPRLALALTWLAGQDERLLEEQVTRVGCRGATERLAHLFIELYRRLLRAGVDEDAARRLPLTQVMLGEALGMSHVHANRCFRELVRAGVAETRDGHVWLLDPGYLADRAGFDPGYLEHGEVPATTRREADREGMGASCA